MLCLNFCRQLRLASEQEGGARCGAEAGIVLAQCWLGDKPQLDWIQIQMEEYLNGFSCGPD